MTTDSGPDPFTDPNELFDIYGGDGHPTGRVKRRADVHRDGDWHRSIHCWATCETDGAAELLFQRRGAHKDTWPNRLDVTVGGHYKAGETDEDVLREAEEEIGQRVSYEQLVRLGRRVKTGNDEPGTVDNEIQEVYLWRSPLRLADYRPQAVEVTALEAVAIEGMLELFAGRIRLVKSRILRSDGSLDTGRVTMDDLIPSPDRYFYRVTMLADLAIQGYPHLVL